MGAGTEAHVFISLPGVPQSERSKPETACCRTQEEIHVGFFFLYLHFVMTFICLNFQYVKLPSG